MHKCRIFLSSVIIMLLFSLCTPYNSDKANYKLIQGRWMLVDVNHSEIILDTVRIDYNKNQTILVFEKNKLTQYMNDLNDTTDFTFVIRDYKLAIFRDSVATNVFIIRKLTGDSLILEYEKGERIYKKTGQ